MSGEGPSRGTVALLAITLLMKSSFTAASSNSAEMTPASSTAYKHYLPRARPSLRRPPASTCIVPLFFTVSITCMVAYAARKCSVR